MGADTIKREILTYFQESLDNLDNLTTNQHVILRLYMEPSVMLLLLYGIGISKVMNLITKFTVMNSCLKGMSIAEIATILRMSSRGVVDAIRTLEEDGLISVTGKKKRSYMAHSMGNWKGFFREYADLNEEIDKNKQYINLTATPNAN